MSWNPFKQKTTQEIKDEIAQQLGIPGLTTTTGGTGPSSGSGVGFPGVFTGAGTHHIGSPAMTQQQLQSILGVIGGNITPEEKAELAQLKLEYAAEIKTHKLLAFKKLAPELRQWVINAIQWENDLAFINAISVPQSKRIQELENKEAVGNLSQYLGTLKTQAHWASSSVLDPNGMRIPFHVSLPNDLTVEDLKQAHIEASLEEEILDGQKE